MLAWVIINTNTTLPTLLKKILSEAPSILNPQFQLISDDLGRSAIGFCSLVWKKEMADHEENRSDRAFSKLRQDWVVPVGYSLDAIVALATGVQCTVYNTYDQRST